MLIRMLKILLIYPLGIKERFPLECLDKNHLYINYSQIDDGKYAVSERDNKLNGDFHGGK